jgi:hypothetical protein
MLQDVLIEALYVDANGPSEAGAGKWDVSFVILPEEFEAPFAQACAEVQEAHPTALAA